MTCPHCGYLLSPLDHDCARCRQRGYAPSFPTPTLSSQPSPLPHADAALSTPPASAPLPYMPLMLPAAPRSRSRNSRRTITFAGMALLLSFMLNLHAREQRYARQQAEIATLQERIRQMQPAESHPLSISPSLLDNPPNLQHVPDIPAEPVSATPVMAARVPKRCGYDPFLLFICRMPPAPNMQRRQAQLRQQANLTDLQRKRVAVAAKTNRAPRVQNMHDPFNPFKRF